MRVQRDPLALRVVGVVGVVGLVGLAERSAVELLAADELLLLGEAGAVPALHEGADQADGLVAAAHGPRGLDAAVAVGADPDEVRRVVALAHVEVGGAVLEAEHVPVLGVTRALVRLGAAEAVDHPVQDQRCTRRPHQLTQCVGERVRPVRRDLDEDVAVAPLVLEPVVGEERHPDQLRRLPVREPVPVVEETGADRDRHRRALGGVVAQDAGRRRRELRVVRRALAHPVAQPLGLRAEVAEHLVQGVAVRGDAGERRQQASCYGFVRRCPAGSRRTSRAPVRGRTWRGRPPRRRPRPPRPRSRQCRWRHRREQRVV